jgi:hypothetical protein
MGKNIAKGIVLWLGLFLILTGSALAEVEGIPCSPEPTEMSFTYGDLITCQINSVGDSDIFRFSGSAGQNIVLQVTSTSSLRDVVPFFS